jgi:hypothetical protein
MGPYNEFVVLSGNMAIMFHALQQRPAAAQDGEGGPHRSGEVSPRLNQCRQPDQAHGTMPLFTSSQALRKSPRWQ